MPERPPTSTRRRGAFGLLAFVGIAYVALAAANPMPGAVHGDGYYTYLWARTLVFDGDLDFHEDYRVCPDPWGLAEAPVAADVNYWNLGPALFWAPILAFDRLTHPVAGGPSAEGRGCVGPLAERAVLGSLVAGLLTVWLGFLVARRHFGVGPAQFGAVAGALLTSLGYYATTMLSYGHAASSFGCAALLYVWDTQRYRLSLRGWLAMGGALGLAMLMRSQNAILVLLPLATWSAASLRLLRQRQVRPLGRHVLHGVTFTLAMLAVFAPQLGYWWHLTGSPFAVSQGEHYMRWGAPRILGALFASSSGLFVWSPVVYVAVAGWLAMVGRRRQRARRALGAGILVLFAADAYVVGSVYDWWGSIGFPGRRFDMLAAPIIVGIAAIGSELRRLDLRHRGAALATAGALVLGGGLIWSVGVYQGAARGMRTDTAETAPTKWRATLEPVQRGLWRAVGNPLSWPASLPFAWRYGRPPRDWDVAGSQELFYHDHQTLERREFEATLRIADPELSGYFGGTFDGEPSHLRGRLVRVASPGAAHLLLPLHWPNLGALELRMMPVRLGARPKVSLRIEGTHCGTRRVAGDAPRPLRFEVPPGTTHHGINEAWLWIEGGAVAIDRGRLLDPRPPPSVEQRRRNERLRESRRGRRAP